MFVLPRYPTSSKKIRVKVKSVKNTKWLCFSQKDIRSITMRLLRCVRKPRVIAIVNADKIDISLIVKISNEKIINKLVQPRQQKT